MASGLSTEDIAYMEAHASDSRVINIIVCCAFCAVLSLLFIILRIWSRRLSGTKLHACDWMVISAWFFYIAIIGCFIGTIPCGGGRHVILLTDARMFAIMMLCNEILYCIVMTLIKLSLLTMYGTIFPQRRYRWALWATAFFCLTWAIWGSLTSIMECIPLKAMWDTSVKNARCIDKFGTLVVVGGAQNILLDFIILALPIPMVLRLHMSTQQKRMLIFTFAMGGSATIVSIVRQVYAGKFSQTSDPTWDDVPSAMVSVSELMVGFLASSIPTYRPLWRHIFSQGDGHEVLRGTGPSALTLPPNVSGQWLGNEKTQIQEPAGAVVYRAVTRNEFGGTTMSEDVELSSQDMLRGHRDDGWTSVSRHGSEDSLQELV